MPAIQCNVEVWCNHLSEIPNIQLFIVLLLLSGHGAVYSYVVDV